MIEFLAAVFFIGLIAVGLWVVANAVNLLILVKNALIFKACSESAASLDWNFDQLEQAFGGLGKDIIKFFGNTATVGSEFIEAYFKYNIIFQSVGLVITLVIFILISVWLGKNLQSSL